MRAESATFVVSSDKFGRIRGDLLIVPRDQGGVTINVAPTPIVVENAVNITAQPDDAPVDLNVRLKRDQTGRIVGVKMTDATDA